MSMKKKNLCYQRDDPLTLARSPTHHKLSGMKYQLVSFAQCASIAQTYQLVIV